MYQEYWGLSEAPFDNVPDPDMYFRMHASVENAIAELLFAIEEGNECLALLIGDVGLGKTMALRVVLDKLEQDKYRTAFITNPDLTFPQLMREIIGQLRGEVCDLRSREALLEHFNRFLFEATDSGQKVLLFIDEGQALRGPVLESMRLLTSIQQDKTNLLTIILAGQPELGTMLTAPRRANLLQRVGVCPILEPLGSEDLVGDYIDHRMERAGSTRNVFTNSGIASIYESSKGVPRIINRFCKLCLKAGETNRLDEIDEEVVSTVANQFLPSRLLQGLTDARAEREAAVQQNSERPADHDAEELPQSFESTPESDTHPIPEAQAVEPDRGVSVSESPPGEATHAIRSDCRVSPQPQQDEKLPDPDPELGQDGDFFDRLRSESAILHPAEPSLNENNDTESLAPVHHDIEQENESLDSEPRTWEDREPQVVSDDDPREDVSSSAESVPGYESHAIKSDCRVSVGARPDEKLPYQEPGWDPDGDLSYQLQSESAPTQPAEQLLDEEANTESQQSIDRDIEADTNNADTVAGTETDPQPEFMPARSEEQISNPIVGSDPIEDLPDHPLAGRNTGPPAVHPPSSNGESGVREQLRHARSRTQSAGMSRAPGSDDDIGQLRQRITKGGRSGQVSSSWVKSLFRGVFR